ncbi:MAG: hypothetical protein PF482_10215, partial [Desulfobacteraceae bacterium]|nr:hypothetical protein [Desulfobacteraceae bacterium]
IVVGGGDTARTVIKEEISPGSYTEVTVDPIPIDEATPQKIADSDNGVIGDDNPPVDPGDDDPGDTNPGDTDTGDTDTGDTDTGDTDLPVTPTITLSAAVSDENDTNITYSVAAAVSGITGSTTVTITVEGGSAGTSTKTLTTDGTVAWSVIVVDEDATVTVSRSDNGDQQSLTLTGKTGEFDGTYYGTSVVTVRSEGSSCNDSNDISAEISGSSFIFDEGSRVTIVGNSVSFSGDGNVWSATINNNVISGIWKLWDLELDESCSGTFSMTKQ